MLYESILAAKPTSDLAFAIRDGVPFDKLKDELIAYVATAVVMNAKGVAKLDEAAKAASEQSTAEPPKEVTEPPPAPAVTGKKK